MGASHSIVSETHLSHFSPLNQLPPAMLEELLVHSKIERLPPGRRLFNREEADPRILFLLSGQLALVSGDNNTRMLRADSREACSPIDQHNPRHVTALARTSVTILSVDAGFLTNLLDRSETRPLATSPHSGNDDEDDRVNELFATPLFSRLPQPHLQVLRNRMTQIMVAAGEALVRAGDHAQYYYIIQTGRFSVTRQLKHRVQKTVLTELGPGDGIGEDALIANCCYDATATALENSQVARFSKGEFLTLLVRPHTQWITYHDMIRMQLAGAILLDVRSPRVFNRHHLPGSINLPLRMLRQMAPLFDRSHNYVVYSDRPRRGATAAFLLARQGMDVKLLSDGPNNAVSQEHEGKLIAGARGFKHLHT